MPGVLGNKSNSTNSTSSSGGVLGKKKPIDPMAKPVRSTRMLPETPSLDIMDSPLMQAVNNSTDVGPGRVSGRGAVEMDEPARNINDELATKAKQLPVIGPILRTLDKFATNDTVDKGANIARSFYIPGAGVANVTGLTGAVEGGLERLLPSLGKTAVGRIGQKAASEAITGVPLGLGQVQMTNPDPTMKDYLEGAAWGAGGGAVLGGLGKGVGEALKYGRESVESLSGNVLREASKNPRSVPSPFSEGSALSNPIAKEYANINQAGADTLNYNHPKNVKGRATSSLEQYKLAMESKYNPSNQNLNVWDSMTNKEKGQMNKLTQAIGSDTPLPIKQEVAPSKPIVQAVEPLKQENRVIVQPEVKKPVQATQEPTQGVRSNFKNQLDNGKFSPELQTAINEADHIYDVKFNRDTVAEANRRVKDLPKAEIDFMNNQRADAEHIATGYRLMQELDAKGEHARALLVSKKLAEDLTNAGQTAQAARVISKLSPEGQFLELVRTAEKSGKEITVEDAAKFKQEAKKFADNSGSGIRENQVNEIVDRIRKGEKVTPDDLNKLESLLSSAEKRVKAKAELPKELKDTRKRDKVRDYMKAEAEKAMQELKQKNGLGFARTVGTPDIVLYTKILAYQIVDKAITVADATEFLVKQAGESMRPYAQEIYDKATKLVNGTAKHISEDKLDKANEAFRKLSGQAEETPHEKIVEKYLKQKEKEGVTLGTKDIENLRQVASDLAKLEGKSKMDADIAMQKIYNKYEKSSLWDKQQTLGYIAMLGNTLTQGVNALSGPIMATTGTLFDILGTMIDIGVSKALKTPRTTTLYGTDPVRFINHWIQNAIKGGKTAIHGADPEGIESVSEIRGLAFKSPKNPVSWAERGLGAVAKGADYGTFKTVSNSELQKLGALDAKKQGIKGRAEIKAHVKQFMNDAPEQAKEQARIVGQQTTFQRKDSLGGQAAGLVHSDKYWIKNVVKPVVQTVLPYIKTPLNMAESGAMMTPAGIIRGVYQLHKFSKAVKAGKLAEFKGAGQREAIRNISSGIVGTAGFTSLGYGLYNIGVITDGNDSGDKNVDAIREQAGKGKYRLNTDGLMRYMMAIVGGKGLTEAEKEAQYRKGDTQLDYNKFQPIALPVSIGASLGKNKDKPTGDKLKTASEDAWGSLFGMSSLQGLQQILQPNYGGTQGEKAVGPVSRIAEAFFKKFSLSLLGQEARREDPIQRKVGINNGVVSDTLDYYKSRIPGLSQTLPPNKTTLGQDKLNPQGFKQYANFYRSQEAPYNDAAKIITDLMERTKDTSIAPKPPEKTVTGTDKVTKKKNTTKPIPQERYTKLQEEVGNEIITKITALDPKLSDEKKITKIKQIYSDVNEKYRNKVKKELGIIIN